MRSTMGIEEDLEKRLIEIDQNLYEEQKARAQQIIEYTHGLLKDLEIEARTDFQRVTIFLFLKGFHIFEAVKVLCEKDHALSATILLRTLLEDTANLLYIYKRPQKRSKRFLAHGPAGTMVMLETLEYMNPGFAETPSYEAAKEMISKQREGIDFDYKPEYNWARKSHAELIKETLPKLYFGFWKSACFVAHPNILELGQYVREKDGKLIIQSEPTKSYRAYALLAAQGCFLLLLETFSKVLKIELSSEIKNTIEEQKKLYS
jgi:hypothetical protein